MASHSPLFLLWRDVTIKQADALRVGSASQKRQAVFDSLAVNELFPANTTQQDVFTDLCCNTLRFCLQHKFSSGQISTLLSILKDVHLKSVAEPALGLQQSFEVFQSLLLRHSVQRPPFSICVFEQADVLAVTNHVLDSYYRHYNMYQYVFAPRYHLDLNVHHSLVDEPQTAFPPLDSSVPATGDDTKQADTDSTTQPALDSKAQQTDNKTNEENQSLEEKEEKSPEPTVWAVPGSPANADVNTKLSQMQHEFENKLKLQEEEFAKRLKDLEGKAKSKRNSSEK